MDRTCSFSASFEESREILYEKWTTAREVHMCHECLRYIVKCEKYYREKTVYFGKTKTHKTCADCKSIRDNLVDNFFWGEILDLVSESIRETGGEIHEKCISALTPAALAWVCDQIEDQWEDI